MTRNLASYRRFSNHELRQRARAALECLTECSLCPRQCRANRMGGALGVCRTGRDALVGSHFSHHGEEDCLRGQSGSGTVFFAWCNLRCVFCQNYDLSWEGLGQAVTAEELAGMMLRLQACGCHNINFVTPSHVVPQLLEAIAIAAERGLEVPLVYNTSAYDRVPTLQMLEGVVDIYMPDFKYWSKESAERYAEAPDYPDVARQAIADMHRQVGPLICDDHGIALRGVLVRHLVMPGLASESRAILSWLAKTLGPQTYVNVMNQYHPAGQAGSPAFPEIGRRVSDSEFSSVIAHAQSLGLRLDPGSMH